MAFEQPLWCQGFCLEPLFAGTRGLLFNHAGALSQALDQMETIKISAGKKKKKEEEEEIDGIPEMFEHI